MLTLRTLGLPRATVILLAGSIGLAACDEDNGNDGNGDDGISSLGDDFVEVFEQSPNDEPIDATGLTLTQTPGVEPFDP